MNKKRRICSQLLWI